MALGCIVFSLQVLPVVKKEDFRTMLTPKLLATSNYSGGRLAFHLLCWDCFRLGVAVGAKKEVRTQESDQEAANTQTYSGGRLAVLLLLFALLSVSGLLFGTFWTPNRYRIDEA